MMLAHRGHHLLEVIVFVILQCVSAGRFVDDPCTIYTTNKIGRCKLISACPKALHNLHSHHIYPQRCGFEGDQPVVCCDEDAHIEKPFSSSIPGGKSKEKCAEYRRYYKDNIAKIALPSVYVPVKEECDFLDWFDIESNKARPMEFPHMVALGYDDEHETSWLCSGALISEEFVLTAAHCLTDRPHGEPKYVRVGDLILNTDHDDHLPFQQFNVAKMFIHPDFEPPSFYHDIGLLKLDKPVHFAPNARPTCLDTNPVLTDQRFVVTGWGPESHTSESSSHLLKQFLHYLPHAECGNVYKNLTYGKKLKHGIMDDTQLCAVPHGNHEKCDIGVGVLQVYNREQYCMYTVIGITSFGRTQNDADVPDVFTRVSAYLEWIEGIVWA